MNEQDLPTARSNDDLVHRRGRAPEPERIVPEVDPKTGEQVIKVVHIDNKRRTVKEYLPGETLPPIASDGASDVPSVAPRQTETPRTDAAYEAGKRYCWKDALDIQRKESTKLERENAELTALAAKQREVLEEVDKVRKTMAQTGKDFFLYGVQRAFPIMCKIPEVLSVDPPTALAAHLREVGELKQRITELQGVVGASEDRRIKWRKAVEDKDALLATQAQELEELRKEKVMLDWLEKEIPATMLMIIYQHFGIIGQPNLRAALRAAMREEKE